VGSNGFGTRTFWTTAIPNSDVTVQFANGQAEMKVQNLALDDYGNKKNAFGPDFQTAFDPAMVSFDVVWNGPITRRLSVLDGTLGNNYAGNYVQNQVTVNWSGTNLATGFSFTANPGTLATSSFDGGFAELGQERNGIFDAGAMRGAALASVRGASSATRASTGTMIVAPPQNAVGPVLGLSGAAGSPSVAADSMSFDAAVLVRALAASPAVAAANDPTRATLPRTDSLAPSRTTEAQRVQPLSATHRLTVRAELPPLVDQVFTDLEGSAITSTLRGEDASAGVV
jgi:hypothetical protein